MTGVPRTPSVVCRGTDPLAGIDLPLVSASIGPIIMHNPVIAYEPLIISSMSTAKGRPGICQGAAGRNTCRRGPPLHRSKFRLDVRQVRIEVITWGDSLCYRGRSPSVVASTGGLEM